MKFSREDIELILNALESHKNMCEGGMNDSLISEAERTEYEAEYAKTHELKEYIETVTQQGEYRKRVELLKAKIDKERETHPGFKGSFADCTIRWSGATQKEEVIIKMSPDIVVGEDNCVFYNVDGIEGLALLTLPGHESFVVDFCSIDFVDEL